MICKNCGNTNPDSAVFCVKCGAQLQSVESAPPLPGGAAAAPYPDSGNETMPSLKHTEPPAAVAMPPSPSTPAPAYPVPGFAPAAAPRQAFTILNRLPVIGGLLAILGYVLPWAPGGGSGVDFFIQGLNALGFVLQNGAPGIAFNQLLIFMVLPILSILILVAGIFGLLSVLGKRGLRPVIFILGLTGLIVFVVFLLLYASFYSMNLGTMAGSFLPWVWVMLAGLVWLCITPWIGWK